MDLVTGRHVRPVLPGRLTTALLTRHGGPFDIASIVDLGPTRYRGQAPETEDYLFDPRRATRMGTMGPEEFWKRLVAASATRLVDLFGRDLTPQGSSSAGVPLGKGIASLGCLIPQGQPVLRWQPREGRSSPIRLRVSDGEFTLDLSVTDIRLYAGDDFQPAIEAVRDVATRLARGVEVVLSVGLTRPFASAPDQPPVHWLQVNGIHLRDDPLWQPRRG